jgi:solute carrier family 35, member F1/2
MLTGQNTTSQLLSIDKVSLPAFQTLFNYVILNLLFTSYTLYKYGFKKWFKLCIKDGWKYFLWAFIDVEGNYCFVLAYRYTNILSATLIDFWAIAVVVAVSLVFLKVRYHLFQYIGILVCIGGLGIILGSDYINGNTDGYAPKDAVKGDLFALLGATFYVRTQPPNPLRCRH